MNCPDAIAALADSAARAEPQLRAHLEGCAGCRAALQDIESLERTAALPSPDALERFPARVQAAHLARRETRPVRMSLFAGALAAGALAAMVALMALPSGHGAAPAGSPSPAATALLETEDCLFGPAAADEFASEVIGGDDLDEDDYS